MTPQAIPSDLQEKKPIYSLLTIDNLIRLGWAISSAAKTILTVLQSNRLVQLVQLVQFSIALNQVKSWRMLYLLQVSQVNKYVGYLLLRTSLLILNKSLQLFSCDRNKISSDWSLLPVFPLDARIGCQLTMKSINLPAPSVFLIYAAGERSL